ncbi:MAG: hypothetical protein PHE18_08060 [Candidatus Omnitrophica bacterium]|nr:hypothetical protein [Candidatus Omnitrophota bacterium]MDD5553807.1 hypothetical protein [Candidatus Omnitrophota bacterium]
MVKKDIYEHLADIYLDASSKKKKRVKKYQKNFKALFFISIGVTVFLAVSLLTSLIKGRNSLLNTEVALVVSPDAVKINFHFDPARKESYSLDLKKLDLRRFKALSFRAKRADFHDTMNMRVEFTNSFGEKGEKYVKNIPHKWQEYKIDFSDFKNISDWSGMKGLAFVIEEWNVKDKRGVVYLDNVRFSR